jgi:hypothetical protein
MPEQYAGESAEEVERVALVLAKRRVEAGVAPG